MANRVTSSVTSSETAISDIMACGAHQRRSVASSAYRDSKIMKMYRQSIKGARNHQGMAACAQYHASETYAAWRASAYQRQQRSGKRSAKIIGGVAANRGVMAAAAYRRRKHQHVAMWRVTSSKRRENKQWRVRNNGIAAKLS